ncbi:methionyl-tRNA formyltransferase [Fodinicola acaciae]|uniref:methionyl-tRNA formyltransferase n=1 Tax=Fodinicola acaciae TaxID=2681555 RepID=UPI0013D82F45|nr:methionyl-tRNA formyltransferase [Fodinicola acaciae]
MKLCFAGTPEPALPALRAIHASSHDLVGVITRPDAPAGRGRHAHRSPVAAYADEHGIEVLTPRRPREPEFQDRLRAIAPDCIPVVAYGALIPRSALDIPKHGWLNLHFSVLPAWRGAAPVQHALLHGDDITGASVFTIEESLDTGPVFGTVTEPIGPHDTSGDLLARLAESGAKLLVAVLDAIEAGTAVAVPQPADGVTVAPKVTVEDAHVRWDEPARAVDRRIRACTPAPGAWTTLDGHRLKLGPATLEAEGELAPGELAVAKKYVLAGTGTTPVRLGEVQAEGKRAMPAADWARGLRLAGGEILGS